MKLTTILLSFFLTLNAFARTGTTVEAKYITNGGALITMPTSTVDMSASTAVSGSNTGDVTLGTANGLSLSNQVLSMQLATSLVPGALSAADWTTFNNKMGTPANMEFGTTDPFGRYQIWNYGTNASLRLGSLGQDGDPLDVNSEGIVVYGANSQGTAINSATGDFGYARIKADRIGLLSSILNTQFYYFRADPTSLYLKNDSNVKTFEVTRSNGNIKTALGAGAVASDASGNLSSGTLSIANGGTNNSTAYTSGSLLYSDGTSITQDNSKLFYNATTKKLGLGTATPTGTLDIFAEEGTTGVSHLTLSGNIFEAGTISRNIAGNGGWLNLQGGSTANGGGSIYLNGNGVADGGSVQMTLGKTTSAYDFFDNTVSILNMRVQNDGNVGIGSLYGDTLTNKLDVRGDIKTSGGLQLATSGAKPTCNVGNRGRIWSTLGASTVEDITEICKKDATDTYVWSNITKAIDPSEKGAANGVATLDASGIVPISQIPVAALERLTVVADQAARYALTTATVQDGDTVKQSDTGEMYFIKDDTNLSNAAGYSIYTAGTASSVAWSGITGVPGPVSSLSGTNTGDQTITLTGGVTGSGVGSFAATVITNADMSGDITSVGNTTTYNGIVPISKGGTGQSTASAAFDALAPSQTSNSGKILGTNGTTTSWVSAPSMAIASHSIRDIFNGDNSTAVFNTSVAPALNTQVQVFLNGILQDYTVDYTITGSAITFVTAPRTGQKITAIYSDI